mmetsp:Transcript_19928/g.41989  ORF Transcript_19928/g.41989 Transcript_19928/m.41989 type:complete len:777 (-) Transcript_19928:655-2985(-)
MRAPHATRRAFRLAGVLHACGDALDGDDDGVREGAEALLGGLVSGGGVGGARLLERLALDHMERVEVRLAHLEGLLGEGLVGDGLGAARHLQEDLDGLAELGAQLLAEIEQRAGAQLLVVVLCDGRVSLRELELDEVDEASEEGPLLVHGLQLRHVAVGLHGAEGVAAAEPDGQVQPHLRPREDPRDGAQRLDAALRLALRRARAEVERAELAAGRRLVEVLCKGAAGRVVDDLLEALGRLVGERLHQLALRRRRQRWRRERVLEDEAGEGLERLDAHLVRSEEGVDLLALHGDAVGVVDRAGGLRGERQVERAAAAADGAAAAVEKVELDTVLLTDGEQLLHGHVQFPQRGELARVLGRVGVAKHHLMEAADALVVDLGLEDAVHHLWRVLQVLPGLEERRDAHRRLDARLLEEETHGEHVRRGARHGDAVRAERLVRDLGEHGEGLEHLLGGRRREREVGRDQRPLRRELCLEESELLLLVPLGVRAEAEEGGDGVDRLRVAVALLPDVEPRQRDAEGAHAADQVEQRAVGELRVAHRDERAVHELERLEQAGGRAEDVGVDLVRRLVVHVAVLHGADGLVEAAADGDEDDAVRLIVGHTRLEVPVHAVVGVLREHLGALGHSLGADQLVDVGAHLLRDGARVRELEEQFVDFLLIELRGAAPHKRHHLHGDLGGDVGVSVAVAAHPRGDLDDGGVVRHGRLADAREGAVEPAVVQRHGVPERLLHHEHAVARLALGRRLRAAHRRRAPARELLLADQALDVGDLTWRERVLLV